MKVWEYISENFDDCNGKNRAQIHNMFYVNRELPCQSESETRIIHKRQLDKICSDVKCDCLQCLERYLDCEVPEKLPRVKMEVEGQISLL